MGGVSQLEEPLGEGGANWKVEGERVFALDGVWGRMHVFSLQESWLVRRDKRDTMDDIDTPESTD